MEQITFKLETFEGPLDLLLSLITKHKMDINDIPIFLLCDQYMAYIKTAQNMNIDLSSEFLYMASELMLIKSRMLLPKADEEEDPRADLAALILEYQRAKLACEQLKPMFERYGGRFAKETDEIAPDKTYVADHDSALLYKAFMKVMTEIKVTDAEAKKKFEPLIQTKRVSVASIVRNLARRLRNGKKVSLGSFFRLAEDKSELVSMFLAMLELLKSGHLILGEENGDESDGVIDAASDITVSLDESADIEELISIVDHD